MNDFILIFILYLIFLPLCVVGFLVGFLFWSLYCGFMHAALWLDEKGKGLK